MRAPASLAVARCRQSEKSHAASVRGKWASPIQHNRALFEVAPVARGARLVGQPLRALRVRITSGYVWRPGRLPHARCCRTHSAPSQCARANRRASTCVWSRAARRCGGVMAPARPAVAGARLALRCSFPRARARSRPPPQAGAPKNKKPNTSTGAPRRPKVLGKARQCWCLCITWANAAAHV